jgi:hypothetical protein
LRTDGRKVREEKTTRKTDTFTAFSSDWSRDRPRRESIERSTHVLRTLYYHKANRLLVRKYQNAELQYVDSRRHRFTEIAPAVEYKQWTTIFIQIIKLNTVSLL